MNASALQPLRRRWYQFSLSSLLVLITVLAIGPGSWILYQQQLARRQKNAVTRLNESGGEVYARPVWWWSLLERGAPGSVVGIALRSRQTNDAGAAHLADLADLIWLDLNDTQITDAALVHLIALPRLKRLRLDETQVSDAGLVPLAKLKQLETLNLASTQVTDAGLMQLACLANLQELSLRRTQVTDAGIAKLQQALPNLKIDR